MVVVVKISWEVIVHTKMFVSEIMSENFFKTAKTKRNGAIHRNDWKNIESY